MAGGGSFPTSFMNRNIYWMRDLKASWDLNQIHKCWTILAGIFFRLTVPKSHVMYMHPTYRKANTVAKKWCDEVWWDEDAGFDKGRFCPILTLIPNHSALAASFSCLVAPNIIWILIHLSLLPKHTDIYRCHRRCKEHHDNPNRCVQKGKLKYTVVLIVSFGMARCPWSYPTFPASIIV